MPIRKLAHFSVRTTNVQASSDFYRNILGFEPGYRPAFDFPGAWLYHNDDLADYGIVHIIGIDPEDSSGLVDYLGSKAEEGLSGSGAVDHIAFFATDLPEFHRRLQATEVPYRERTVPNIGLHQMFFEDPSGITIELNFPASEATPQGATQGA